MITDARARPGVFLALAAARDRGMFLPKVIEIRDTVFRYPGGDFTLRIDSLDVASAEQVALIGAWITVTLLNKLRLSRYIVYPSSTFLAIMVGYMLLLDAFWIKI